MFLNTEGTLDDVGSDLKAFLDYMEGGKSDHRFVKKLEAKVSRENPNREWRRESMTLLMRDQENIEKGIKQGIGQGKTSMRNCPRSCCRRSSMMPLGGSARIRGTARSCIGSTISFKRWE